MPTSGRDDIPPDAIPPGRSVDRCVCYDVPFAEIMRATGHAYDPERARAEFGCGSGCGLCWPYVKLAMRTGRDAFPVIPPERFVELGIDPDVDSMG